MYNLVNFWNFMKKTRKKLELCRKKLIVGQTYIKFAVSMATTKVRDTQLTYQNFPEG